GGGVPSTAHIAMLPPPMVAKQPIVARNTKPTTVLAGSHCFKCGKTGHRIEKCKNNDRTGKGLFADSGDLIEDLTDDFELKTVSIERSV
ncbi:unnamed protein product, partial [Ilex paraguariensis]